MCFTFNTKPIKWKIFKRSNRRHECVEVKHWVEPSFPVHRNQSQQTRIFQRQKQKGGITLDYYNILPSVRHEVIIVLQTQIRKTKVVLVKITNQDIFTLNGQWMVNWRRCLFKNINKSVILFLNPSWKWQRWPLVIWKDVWESWKRLSVLWSIPEKWTIKGMKYDEC